MLQKTIVRPIFLLVQTNWSFLFQIRKQSLKRYN